MAKVGDKVGGIKSGSTFVLREAQGKQEVVLQMKLELAIRIIIIIASHKNDLILMTLQLDLNTKTMSIQSNHL